MAYKMPTQKYSGKILEVTVGSDLKLGGESVLPFYSFDGNIGNKPAIGMEIWDIFPDSWPEGLINIFKDVAGDPAKWAKFCVENYNPDFICLRFEGSNPDDQDKSPEECAEVAKKVAESVFHPLFPKPVQALMPSRRAESGDRVPFPEGGLQNAKRRLMLRFSKGN